MAHIYEFPNATTGIDAAFVGVATAVPAFIPLALLFIWLFVTIGGVSSQKRRTGTSDVPIWATLGSLATLFVALVLSTTEGLMNVPILSVTVAITIICAFWLFFSKGKGQL